MARLILINGIPGSGTSTLARRWAAEHPLGLALDLDVVRSLLGRWLETPAAAGVSTRAMAVEMARVHLATGHDVLVPQFLGRVDFVLTLERLAAEVGVPFVEVALLTEVEVATDRFRVRSADASRAEHAESHELLSRAGGLGSLPTLLTALLDVVAARPRTRLVTPGDADLGATYALFVAVLDG